MKKLISVAACMLITGAIYAQSVNSSGASPNVSKQATTSAGKPAGQRTARVHKNAIGGTIINTRKQPVARVQTYVYIADTAIVASGYTTADGKYETNSMMPGTYTMKVVSPASKKRIFVTGIPVKQLKITQVNLTLVEPSEDTSIPYVDLLPPSEKKVW